MKFDRIAVVGISGSGKSAFAKTLAARTGLPLRHGDQLEWLANWQARPAAEIQTLHRSWIAQPCWIIEGWMDVDRVGRLNRADVVVDLDVSSVLCMWRTLRRMQRRVRREEMPVGCVDRFNWKYLAVVLGGRERPALDAALAAATMKMYVHLKSPQEAAAWLKQF